MTGHFKVNGVGTLWLPGDDEVMAKEVGAVMIVWELWRGTVTREASYGDEMIFFCRRCKHAHAGYWRERMY